MNKWAILAIFVALIGAASAKTYFKEQFNDDAWSDRWTVSSGDSSVELGAFKQTAGEFNGDASDKGIKTSEDARHYRLSAPFTEEFDNDGKPIVLQYSVKHEQDLDCGGAYLKLAAPGIDHAAFGPNTDYKIMFGPDVCGTTRRTHVIFNYPKSTESEKNLLRKSDVRTETDKLSHLYTLIVNPDNTYEVRIDGKKVEGGNLADDWNFLPAKKIKDPNESKPSDWVDEKKIPDPEDKKPEGWDDIPSQIPDPDATKPEDWDDEDDGEWEAPMIDNPEYKGVWKPKMIDNPDYKGEWVHPEIDNPDYFDDDKLYHRCDACGSIGFELWQVKSGTIFDDIIVTDSVEEAEEFAQETFFAKKDGEKAAYDAAQAEKAKAAEEAAKAAEAAKEEEADDEDLDAEDAEL
jgi:calreticulin